MTKTVLRAAVAMAFLSAFGAVAQVLPKPEEAFKDATIGRTYKESKPGTMRLTKAPSGAPNVLIILIDDSGFGQWGTFGGQVLRARHEGFTLAEARTLLSLLTDDQRSPTRWREMAQAKLRARWEHRAPPIG
jgi:MerR, DNA binding